MNEQEIIPPEVDAPMEDAAMPVVPMKHIIGLVAKGISTDGTSACLRFAVAGATPDDRPDQIDLTLPIDQLTWLATIVHELRMEGAKRFGEKTFQGQQKEMLHFTPRVEVGHTDQTMLVEATGLPLSKHVMLVFNPDEPTRTVYALPNILGMELSDILKHDISPRLSGEDRRKVVEAAKQRARSTQQIIRPPGLVS